ncbi:hypothetical protein [Streptomyces sp. NPDC002746]
MEFEHPGDLAVDVTELAWRQADRPHLTHRADFTPAVAAAIAPLSAQQASAAYRARYDENGFLDAAARDGVRSFADRAAQIQAMAQTAAAGAGRPCPDTTATVRATADGRTASPCARAASAGTRPPRVI